MKNLIARLAASATAGDSEKPFDVVVPDYAAKGYKMFEMYAVGRGSSPDYAKGPAYYRDEAQRLGITYSSLHLPAIEAGDEAGFEDALGWARFAEALDIPVCVFNSASKETYIPLITRMAHAIEPLKLDLVVQIHHGRSIETLEEVANVIHTVNHPKVKVLHELGSYHEIGVGWQQVIDTFGDKIGLFHLKDMVGGQSVPFGTGEIDFAALFTAVEAMGYQGAFVIELNTRDKENTNRYIGEAFEYLRQFDD